VRKAFVDYFRCPEVFVAFELPGELSADEGYFRVGEAICYGRLCDRSPAPHVLDDLEDVAPAVSWNGGGLRLPYDLTQIVHNLQYERYRLKPIRTADRLMTAEPARDLYYMFRPYLPVGARKHIQRLCLNGWEDIPFPRWPVDCTVDSLMRHSMASIAAMAGPNDIPFVWFWPEGAQACLVMTHDVESPVGRELCPELIALDESYGIKSAFHLIPEGGYDVGPEFIAGLRDAGCEVNVHDLNHDGRLFHSHRLFTSRAARINEYGRTFNSRGFRSGAMYRRQDWFGALEFSYDMSVPNVSHLEPQDGGCCSVMPFFIGRILELPLTTAQDYSLFHVLGAYSIDLWRQQIDTVLAENGLVTMLTHPDYLVERRARGVYVELLRHLAALREGGGVWFTLPGEVDRWWRNRSLMSLVRDGNGWRIEGPDSDRAVLAHATLEGGRVVYSVGDVVEEVA
jgi:hypothetical protein